MKSPIVGSRPARQSEKREQERDNEGDWYPGKESKKKIYEPSSPWTSTSSTSRLGHVAALELFDTYLRRRLAATKQITRYVCWLLAESTALNFSSNHTRIFLLQS